MSISARDKLLSFIGFFIAALLMALPAVTFAQGAGENCVCDDSFNPYVGCCGGDGQRPCAITPVNPLSTCPTVCTGDNLFNALTLTCTRPRMAGEICGPAIDCGAGHDCVPMRESETSPIELRCLKTVAGDPGSALGPAVCDLLHSSSLHDEIKSGPENQDAVSFGIGGQAAAGASATFDSGVIYGRDGEFGCYYTTCTGLTFQAGVSAFAARTSIDGFEKFTGPSDLNYIEAGVLVLGFSIGTISPTNQPFNPFGTAAAFSIGVELLPFAPGLLTCSTTTEQTRFGPPTQEQWVDTAANGINPNGSRQQPWHDLPSALTSLESLPELSEKKVFIKGSASVIPGDTIDFPLKIFAIDGPINITAP